MRADHTDSSDDALDPHTWAALRLIWYVNGTLAAEDVGRLEAHLADCADCQRDLTLERAVADRVRQTPTVEYAPAASLRRLRARIAETDPDESAAPPRRAGRRRLTSRIGPGHWLSVAASVVAMAGLVWLTWPQSAHTPTAEYQTLSQATAPVNGPHVQVVFAETATAADMRAALARVRGRIASGPAINGLFLVTVEVPGEPATLAEVEDAARTLMADPAVRFAAAQADSAT